MYEAEIIKLEGMKLMMEQHKESIVNLKINICMVGAKAEFTRVVKELTKEADIDKFHEISKMHEEIEGRNNEINDFFKNYAEDQTEDCEDDLAELEAELAEEELDEIEDKLIREGKFKGL